MDTCIHIFIGAKSHLTKIFRTQLYIVIYELHLQAICDFKKVSSTYFFQIKL